MFATLNNPAAAYRKAGVETKSETASPHELVLMLFDGALVAVASAQHHLAAGNIPGKGESISQAIAIIENGLKASLDHKEGGGIAERLCALYDYMCTRLLHANLYNDPAILKEVHGLLGELRSAWAEIATDPAVLSANALGA